MLDDLGLVPAVEWLVENFTQRTGIAVRAGASATPSMRAAEPRTRPPSSASCRNRSPTSPSMRRPSSVDVAIEQTPTATSSSACATTAADSHRRTRASPVRFGLLGTARARLPAGRRRDDRERAGQGHGIELRLPIRRSRRHMIRVLIADDHTIVREGLKQLLARGRRSRRRGRGAGRPRSAAAGARARFRRAAARHVDARQERHRADQAGQGGEAQAARPGAQHARGAPVRGARDQGRRVRLPDQGQRLDAARGGDPQGRRRRRIHQRGGRRAACARAPCRTATTPPHATLSDREYQVFQLLVSGESVTDIARG